MNFSEAVFKRRSIRKYQNIEVSDQDLEKLIEYGMAAPSAKGVYPLFFYIVKKTEILHKLYSVSNVSIMLPPAIIVVCGKKDPHHEMMFPFWVQDASAAVQNILLGATSLGLGTCWIGVYPKEHEVEKVKTILAMDNDTIPLCLITIGYPAEEKELKQPKYIDKIKKI